MKTLILITSMFLCLSYPALSIGKAEIIKIIADNPEIKYKDITIAQFILETGHNRSRLARHNNIFGIKYNRKFANGKIGSYATYRSINDCILHYIFIQNYFSNKYNILTKKDYIWFLKKKYATSKFYAKRVSRIALKYKIYTTNVSSDTL
jgi:flagellum-specific peptidoglycan hydrolase FlgJ